jgi:DNA polymerase-3 subunit alpha
MEPILSTTYGVITYQEQVMRIAQTLAGISLAEADVLRKAVGKKDPELISRELGKFVEKAVARGHDSSTIEEISSQIRTFGRYGFNKSHSVAYSVIGYRTAWLKLHYPAEFMAALLSSCIGDSDSVVKYINEAREIGLEVLPPDVNESGFKFTVISDKSMRFGLGAIRNVGRAALDSILAARSDGPFLSLFDLCRRVDLRMCNKRVFEALIAAGALDSLGGHRAQYMAALDAAMQHAALTQADHAVGQVSLFGDMIQSGGAAGVAHEPALPNVSAWSDSERLAREKEILGFYTSGHPLEPFRAEVELFATHTVAQLGTWSDEAIALGVVVTSIKRQVSKRSGSEFARLTVEDFSGSAEVLVFPEAWAALSDRLRTDVPLLMKGSYSRRDQDAENPTFIVEGVTPFAELRANGTTAVELKLGLESGLAPGVMEDVREALELHAGLAPVEIAWSDGNGVRVRFRSRRHKVAVTAPALGALRALLGQERVKLVRGG